MALFARPLPTPLRPPLADTGSAIADVGATAARVRPTDTGARLGTALLGYVAMATLIITLVPFEFAIPSRPRILVTGPLSDVAANVVLFVPLGFLYSLTRGRTSVSPARALVVGLVTSLAIESAQLFEATRYASVSDVAANGVGAWLGALAHGQMARHFVVDGETLGRLALELPLMGLVYLLVPLLWLDGVARTGQPTGVWTLLVLGLFGASLLAAIQREHFAPHGLLSRRGMTAAASGWFMIGALPGLAPRASIVLIAMVAAIASYVWVRAGRDGARPARPINRRFEASALRGAAPFYAAYLVLISVGSLGGELAEWRGVVGFDLPRDLGGATAVLRILESVAAFTLLGYMIAELRGRREESYRSAVRRLALWGGLAALACEAIEGFDPDGSASLARLLLVVGACLYGGWLYHLQRAHVRRLLGRG